MSDTLSTGSAATTGADDRILATLLYVLMFLTPFFLGLPALVAVVGAYVRRPHADAFARSHYGFQIKIFWATLLVLALATAAAFVGAGVLVGHFMDLHLQGGGGGWAAWDVTVAENPAVHLNVAALVILVLSALAILGAMVWMMLAAVFGVARLLSGEPIGRLKAA